MASSSQTIATLPVGVRAVVTAMDLPPESGPRLMEMGLFVGTTVELVRFAPLGDPLEIKIRGCHLSLRKSEAEHIHVSLDVSGTSGPASPVSQIPSHFAPAAAFRRNPRSPQDKPQLAMVSLTGNPNSGKTSVFNALTGLRAKVGNYPGVTVERKEGRLSGVPEDLPVTVLDLPGSYSLSPQSPDEKIAHDVLLHGRSDVAPPDVVVVVVDASNLERNLYYATQVIELGYPTLVALNMVDVAEANGHRIDADLLGRLLGVTVVSVKANTGYGILKLREQILNLLRHPATPSVRSFCDLPAVFRNEIADLAKTLETAIPHRRYCAQAEALLLLSQEPEMVARYEHYSPSFCADLEAAKKRLEGRGIAWRRAAVESRYARAAAIDQAANLKAEAVQETFTDRVDSIVTHKVWGLLIFTVVMVLLFQSLFTFARFPMEAMEFIITRLGEAVGSVIPRGPLHSLVEDGIVAGVGSVVVFLPQIALLFLFIGLLEDTGYMARAAFLVDRLMSKVGLHGKSFIPMLSCFACAIPGIMATRTIESPKDRMVTRLVAPLVSCSARLPVYTLLIAACVPDRQVLGLLRLPALTMVGMYVLGIVAALVMAWFFKRFLFQGKSPIVMMELPPYKRPAFRALLRHVWDRVWLFLKKAGTVILGINILLWFLVSYPKDLHKMQASDRLQHSLAGRMGKWIEPVISPLGMDWRMGIGIVTSFAAREVFVSTLSTVYNVEDREESGSAPETLPKILQEQKRPDGSPLYTPLMGVTLMVFYVFALQCASTVAIMHRETNSWKWACFQWAYMGVLAWLAAFATYQGGRWLGWQ